MSKYASLYDLKQVAKAFCKKFGYTYIFANEYKFGYEDAKGGLWTMSYFELEDYLKGVKNNE